MFKSFSKNQYKNLKQKYNKTQLQLLDELKKICRKIEIFKD